MVGVGPSRKKQSHRRSRRGMKHEDAAVHALDAALLLVARALEPPVNGDDLPDLQSLRVHYALGARPFFTGVELGHPHAERFVGSPEPLERGLGQEMRGDARCHVSCPSPTPQPPAGGDARNHGDQQREERHPRNHPRRRNQR